MCASRYGLSERCLGAFAVEGVLDGEPVRRWDGAARTCHEWDELKRDPELWFRNGNCLVHLYGKGQSRRGPSFKLPFNDLLAAKCFPLIERFFVSNGPSPRTLNDFDTWSRQNPRHTVELYIPPPPAADKDQAFTYHVATRNFFAWVFRRSLVGAHLGEALVGLLHSMHEFRSHLGDNTEDILDYMDEEGYLDIVNQPNHALAVLHFAENFQMRELYIRSFAHCVGMSEQLFKCPDYGNISLESRKLMRKARVDLECRVYSATDRLKNLLDEELSEANLGLPSGARAHLERFRSFLMSYYATRFGYYPPRSFEPSLCTSMRDDFEALYRFLVDGSYSVRSGLPSVAVGGICTLQLIQTFDKQCQYVPLEHPLPRLPDFQPANSGHWSGWRPRLEKGKLRSGDRRMAHTSLVRASNWKESIFQNGLVKAYRGFEEESVLSPNKADKQEKVSVGDARKVRWILIYAAYQVLRSVTENPPEVYDNHAAPYHVTVSTENLPPWEKQLELDRLLRRQTDLALFSSPSPPIVWTDSAGVESQSGKIEIKPDIDYFALNHQQEKQQQHAIPTVESSSPVTIPSRNSSLSQSLSRNSTIRRSMRLFRPSSTPSIQRASSLSRPVYHEIVVQGYGNGTNVVHMDPEVPPVPLLSSESDSAAGSSSSQASSESDDTLDDSIKTPSPTEPLMNTYFPVETKPLKTRRDVVSMIASPTLPLPTRSLRRPRSTTGTSSNNDYSSIYEELVEEQRRTFFNDDCPAPLHIESKPDLKVSTSNNDISATRKRHSLHPRQTSHDDWLAMQEFMDGGKEQVLDYDEDDADVEPAWEQYADLGGLTEMR